MRELCQPAVILTTALYSKMRMHRMSMVTGFAFLCTQPVVIHHGLGASSHRTRRNLQLHAGEPEASFRTTMGEPTNAKVRSQDTVLFHITYVLGLLRCGLG